MAGADRNGRYDLDQWKKALLSRDFDLVHTQLLMLDGDVTPSERAQLVQEIFTVVQQIEELTIGNPYLQGADNSQRSEAQEQQPDYRPSATSSDVRQMYPNGEERESSAESSYRRPRRGYEKDIVKRITDLPKNELGQRYIVCPVCKTKSNICTKGVREDWYCNSCRLFKMRLEKRLSKRQRLPFCNHEGKKIRFCKGCRRYMLEVFWMDKRHQQTPYSLPLMSAHQLSHSESTLSADSDDAHKY